MRIPCTIESNTLEVYKRIFTTRISSSLEKSALLPTIKSEDFKWDVKIVKSLQEFCVQCIADNWELSPLLEEILLPTDKCFLLEILSIDLPLHVTIPRIDYDIYWKRCYTSRWPKQLPKPNTLKPVNVTLKHRKDNTKSPSPRENEDHNFANPHTSDHISLDSVNSKHSGNGFSSKSSSDDGNNDTSLKTWKQYFVEMHIKHFLENLKPEDYNAEQIKEITDLCNSHVQKISVDQLLCAGNSANRIPLNAILTGFPHLSELSLCFKQTYVGENFTWNIVKVLTQDVKLLAKGLEKCNLNCFRLTNSDIDDEKAITILNALTKNKRLRIIDFSHCTIGDRGAFAMSKFSYTEPVQEIILSNNNIGPRGAQALAYALLQSPCEVTYLDLKLNSIRDEGASWLLGVLSSNSAKLTHIDLAACDITERVQNLSDVLMCNTRLNSLKLSNNKLGESSGKTILDSLKSNRNIRILDIRMCNISSDVECRIRNQLEFNRKQQKLHKISQAAEHVHRTFTAFDEDIVNDLEYILQ